MGQKLPWQLGLLLFAMPFQRPVDRIVAERATESPAKRGIRRIGGIRSPAANRLTHAPRAFTMIPNDGLVGAVIAHGRLVGPMIPDHDVWTRRRCTVCAPGARLSSREGNRTEDGSDDGDGEG
jgi:hypothetical protein